MSTNNCNTCSSDIGVPQNASSWNTPNFTGCVVGSLPPAVCEGFGCIEKVPACSVEAGHILKLIKLSNYIDLDKLAGLNPDLVQTKFDNEEILKAITTTPIPGIKDGINTIAHQHCDGTYQVDLVSPVALNETQKVQYCGANGTTFFVATGEVNPDSVQVFVLGALVQDYTLNYNGSNTTIILSTAVTNACVDIFWQVPCPTVVQPVDEQVKVSATDIAGFLENKISGTNGITVTKQTFGTSEYMQVELDNPLPTPTAADENKVIYVDATGQYALGTVPCGSSSSLSVQGTDTVGISLDGDILDFNSNDLDIIFSDVTVWDGIKEVQLDLKAGAQLFGITNEAGTQSLTMAVDGTYRITSPDASIDVNINGNDIELQASNVGGSAILNAEHSVADGTGNRTFEVGFMPSSYEILAWDQTNGDDDWSRAFYDSNGTVRGVRHLNETGETAKYSTITRMIDIRFNNASTSRTRAEHVSFTATGIVLNFVESTQDVFFTIIAHR